MLSNLQDVLWPILSSIGPADVGGQRRERPTRLLIRPSLDRLEERTRDSGDFVLGSTQSTTVRMCFNQVGLTSDCVVWPLRRTALPPLHQRAPDFGTNQLGTEPVEPLECRSYAAVRSGIRTDAASSCRTAKVLWELSAVPALVPSRVCFAIQVRAEQVVMLARGTEGALDR